MKIRVCHRDGRIETLTMTGPLKLTEGKHLNYITDATGMDHYFYPEDGCYDGWGRGFAGGVDEETAHKVLEDTERARDIDAPSGTDVN